MLRKLFTKRAVKPWHSCPELWVPHPWRCPRPFHHPMVLLPLWTLPTQPIVSFHDLQGPLQPKPFSDSLCSDKQDNSYGGRSANGSKSEPLIHQCNIYYFLAEYSRSKLLCFCNSVGIPWFSLDWFLFQPCWIFLYLIAMNLQITGVLHLQNVILGGRFWLRKTE